MNNQEKIKVYNLFKSIGYTLSEVERVMKVIIDNSISLERVNLVLEVAKRKEWGVGAIYNALKENWDLTSSNKKIIQQEKSKRLQNLRLNVLEKIKKERERDSRKIEKGKLEIRQLDIYFSSLDKEIQYQLDEEAKRKWLNMVGTLGKGGEYPKICTFYPLVRDYMVKHSNYI